MLGTQKSEGCQGFGLEGFKDMGGVFGLQCIIKVVGGSCWHFDKSYQ